MSGVFPPGTRPDQWSTLGDHQRRLQALEAVPCCFNSGLGPNTTYADLVLANPCAYSYWPMDDDGPGARDLIGTLDLAENPTGNAGGQPYGSQNTFSFVYGVSGPFADSPESTAIQFDGNTSLAFGRGTLLWANLPSVNPLKASPYSMIGWEYAYDEDLSTLWSTYLDSDTAYRFAPPTPKIHYTVGSDDAAGSTTVLSGSWRFVATTLSGTAMKLYVGGALDATATGTASSDASVLRFGAQGTGVGGPTNYLRGKLAQWALFSCALSADEIAEFAAATNAPDISAEAGMVPVADGGGSYSWEFPLEVTY